MLINSIEHFYYKLRYQYKNPILKKAKIYSLLRYLTRCYANKFIPLYLKYTANNDKYQLQKTDREQKIIVSLTSFPKRINTLWLVIETIFRQNTKPDKIILWLSKEQFPGGINSLPSSLTSMCKRGLTIRFTEGDIRSHKKYLYAITEFPNDILVTIDDDIYYSEKLIETLYEEYKKNPEIIQAKYAYEIAWNHDATLKEYGTWTKVYLPQPPSNRFFFGTGGGTLFPPNSLYDDIRNIELAVKLCPLADDVYVNAMAKLNNTKIAVVDQNFIILPITIEDDEKLANRNIDLGQNDMQIQAIREYYKEKGKNLFELK